MGYISNVRDAKDILEKLYKSNNNNKKIQYISFEPPQRLL